VAAPATSPAPPWVAFATPLRWLALLVLPFAVFFVLRVEPYFRQNGVDPGIYAGYAENLPDLVERFGYPYFAVRFGLILPLRLFGGLFGIVGGYFALRYALALLCAGALVLLGRELRCVAAGWFGAVMCLTSPVFLRALMTSYSDTVALPCVLAGVILLLLPGPRGWGWALGAGVLFGFAVHANPFTGLVLVAALGARAMVPAAGRARRGWHDLLVAAAGMVLVTVGGIAYYAISFGSADVLAPSLEAAGRLAGETKSFFRSPDLGWLQFSPHLYVPLLTTVLLAGLVLTRGPASRRGAGRPALVAEAMAMLLAVQLLYVVEQFLRGGFALETYYYSSYLFAFTAIGLTVAMAEVSRRSGTSAPAWVAAIVVAVLPLSRDVLFSGLQIWVVPAVPLLGLGLVALLAVGRARPRVLAAAAVLTAAVSALLVMAPPRNVPLAEGQRFRQEPHYELATGNPDRTGLEWLRLSSQLIAALPAWSDEPGSIVFWYRDSRLLDFVQSTYLWRTSAVQGYEPTFPHLTAEARALLTGRTPRFLVVLATSPDDVDLAAAALDGVGLEPVTMTDEVLRAGASSLLVRRYTLVPAACETMWPRGAFPVTWLELEPCR
jgi:hypothetical protein